MTLFNSINVDSVDSVGFLEPVYGCVYVFATVDWIPLDGMGRNLSDGIAATVLD